jgi:hypothetical protein
MADACVEPELIKLELGSHIGGNPLISDLGHVKVGAAGAPYVFTWMEQRFAGVPAGNTCKTTSPVTALQIVKP